jgi:O-antigen/teichoic acid export membrane protein
VPTAPRNFVRNAFSGYVATGWGGVVSLLVTPLLVRSLGKEQFGIWTLAGSLALYLELLEFGFGGATIKFVAEARARGDDRGLRAAVATSFQVLAAFGAVALVVGETVAAFFPSLFHVGVDLARPASIAVGIVALDLALSIPMDTFGGALVGMQRFDLVNATLVATTTAQAASWAVVLYSGGGLVPLAIVTAAWGIAGQLSRFMLLRRLVPRASLSWRLVDRTMRRSMLTQSGWFALIDVAVLAVVRVDTVIVAALVSVPAAAIYGVAQKLVSALERLVSPIAVTFFPHSSELAAARDRQGLRTGLLTGSRGTLIVAAPLSLTLAVFARPIVDAWVGPGFGRTVGVLDLLLAYAVIAAFTRPAYLMLQGSGHARTAALLLGAEALLNIGLSVALGLAYGILGVAAATVVAGAAVRIALLVPRACRALDVRLRELLAAAVVPHVVPAAIAAALGLLLRSTALGHGPALAVAVPLVLCVYGAGLAVTALDARERRTVASTLRTAVRRPGA